MLCRLWHDVDDCFCSSFSKIRTDAWISFPPRYTFTVRAPLSSSTNHVALTTPCELIWWSRRLLLFNTAYLVRHTVMFYATNLSTITKYFVIHSCVITDGIHHVVFCLALTSERCSIALGVARTVLKMGEPPIACVSVMHALSSFPSK